MVHEEIEGLLLPGAPGVLVATEAAQQLDARTVAGSVVGTTTHTHTGWFDYPCEFTPKIVLSLTLNVLLTLIRILTLT